MDDSISRQAALKALEFTWAGKAAFDAIKALPSTQRWVPVTERLPKDGTEVWVTTEMLSEVTRARWHEDSNLWCHPYHSDCVLALRPIAWMPFERPEPWKGVGEDNEQ